MIQFYVKDLSSLEKYGFNQLDSGRGRYVCKLHKRTWNMGVDKDSQRLTFYSPSRECIALVCEMYKNVDIEIFEDTVEHSITMKVSEEEARIIYQMRKLNESEVNKDERN